ncbi:MAG: hypothetical protein COY57_02820 [Flavobacteriales bacterium CG_4_10_14_0_8_um_filter_32_5]|nr:MAG: hypothetical protein COY57_02820 [Flavobacteriales bacterium CG_4_10_14_0_8_um_filter_32_5]
MQLKVNLSHENSFSFFTFFYSFRTLLVLNQLILATDLEFIKMEELNKLSPHIDENAMMLNELKKSQLNY